MAEDFTKMLQAHIAKVEGREADDQPAAAKASEEPEKPETAETPKLDAGATPAEPAAPAAEPPATPVKPAAPAVESKGAVGTAPATEPPPPAAPDISKLPPEFQAWYKAEQDKSLKQAENFQRQSNKIRTLSQTLNRRENEIADLRASVVRSGAGAAPSPQTTAAPSPAGSPPNQATASQGAATEVFSSPEWRALKKDYPEFAVLERVVGSQAEQIASLKSAAAPSGSDPALIERLARIEERMESERFRDVEQRHRLNDHVGVHLNRSGDVTGVEPRSQAFAWFWYGLSTEDRAAVNWNDPADIDALFTEMATQVGKAFEKPAPTTSAVTPAPPATTAQQTAADQALASIAAPTMRPATVIRSSTANSAPAPFVDAMSQYLKERGYNPTL